MAQLPFVARGQPSNLPAKPKKAPLSKDSKPRRAKGGKPVPPPKPAPKPEAQERAPDGRFGPRIPLPPEEEEERQARKDLRRLVKFEEVVEAVEKYRRPLRTGGRGSDSTPDEIIDAMLNDIRGRLLYDENPRVIQRLAPLEKQPLGAQILMEDDPKKSIQRRYGGAGFGADSIGEAVERAMKIPKKDDGPSS